MTRRRRTAAAALLCAAVAAAGCGIGPGGQLGEATLTVTRDYGARVLAEDRESVDEADTVMRLLERTADVDTRYGGGFVQSIDGLAGDDAGSRPRDWFFYVNGVESTVGAADYSLGGGEAIWWDYRDWGEAMRVPAVVGSWPQPFLDGYEGQRRPVAVRCLGGAGACRTVRGRLAAAGAQLAHGAATGAIRVLVGPWRLLRRDPAAAQLERGPQTSGVFARPVPGPEGFRFEGLDERGREVRELGPSAGLVAATRRLEAQPVWLVTGATPAGVTAAAGLLRKASLRNRYAVLTEHGEEEALPLR
jgi:hypothetical protein